MPAHLSPGSCPSYVSVCSLPDCVVDFCRSRAGRPIDCLSQHARAGRLIAGWSSLCSPVLYAMALSESMGTPLGELGVPNSLKTGSERMPDRNTPPGSLSPHYPNFCDRPEPALPSALVSPTSLEAHETSGLFDRTATSPDGFDLRTNLVMTFRHSFWRVRRAATYRALRSIFDHQDAYFDFGQNSREFPANFGSPDPASPESNLSLDPPSTASALSLEPPSSESPLSLEAPPDIPSRAAQAIHRISPHLTTMVSFFPTTETSPMRLIRFSQCGYDAWVQMSTEIPARYRVVSNRCRDRFCEACQREKRRTICNNVARVLEGRVLRLLTLTLKSSEDPLQAQLNRLYKCFRGFRRDPRIRPLMLGGIFFTELTLNDMTGLWHPHLHIIFEGSFLPQKLAKAVWLKATGDSYVVDIRAIGSSDSAASYIAKYASKALSGRVWRSHAHLLEAITALHGRHTFSCFGSFVGLHLSVAPCDDVDWVYFGKLSDLLILAKTGDDECLRVVQALMGSATPEPIDTS